MIIRSWLFVPGDSDRKLAKGVVTRPTRSFWTLRTPSPMIAKTRLGR